MSQIISPKPANLNTPAEAGDVEEPQLPQEIDGRSTAVDFPIAFDETAILLDIDGTLLDIAPKPHDVHVSPELRRMLARLAQRLGGALGLISGRSLARIAPSIRFSRGR